MHTVSVWDGKYEEFGRRREVDVAALSDLTLINFQPPMRALRRFLVALMLICHSSLLFGQSTAFTYQGRLNDGSNPANGSYDLRFAVFDKSTNGNQQGPILTNGATSVSNGLFNVVLDFGNQFSGPDRWLEIAVRTNGNGNFITLSPRQPVTAIPYAITAANVLAGGIPSGIYTNAVIFSNPGNQFAGNGRELTNLNAANVFGTFTGNGSGLTGLPSTEVDISLSPYNVTNNGVTDNTYAITNALAVLAAKGQGAYLPAGTYFTHPFTMYSGQSLHGAPGTRLLFPSTFTEPNAITMDYYSPNISIVGIEVDGGNADTTPASDDGRVGLLIYNIHQKGWRVENIYAHGFGRGIELYGAYSVAPSEINLFSCIAKYNFIGLSVLSGAEYLSVHGFESTFNYFGIYLEAGNDNFFGCNFSQNTVGLNMAANGNPAHGSFTGCSFNHETIASLVATNIPLGEIFQGCAFLPPNLMLTNCQGIVFNSCLMGWNTNTPVNIITFDHSTNCNILSPVNPYAPQYTNSYSIVITNSAGIGDTRFIGSVTAGTFTGNGSGLTNLNLPFAPATNTIVYITNVTGITNASGVVTNLTLTLGTNTIYYQQR